MRSDLSEGTGHGEWKLLASVHSTGSNLYQVVPVLGLDYGSRSIDVTDHPVVLLLTGHMLTALNFPKCQQPTGVYIWV